MAHSNFLGIASTHVVAVAVTATALGFCRGSGFPRRLRPDRCFVVVAVAHPGRFALVRVGAALVAVGSLGFGFLAPHVFERRPLPR